MNTWHDLGLDESLIEVADDILMTEGLSQMLNLGWKQLSLAMIVATDDKKFLSNVKMAIKEIGVDAFVDTLRKEHRKLYLAIVTKIEKNSDYVKKDEDLHKLASKLGIYLK